MPVLMLHSSLSSGRQWLPFKRQLAPLECWAPDLLGYSGAECQLQRPFALEQEAEALRPWLEQQQAGSVILAGHSFGGAVALHLARCYPMQIKALMLFEPVAFHVLAQQHGEEEQQLLTEVVQLSHSLPKVSEAQGAELFVDYWQEAGYFAALPEVMQQKMAAQVWKVSADFEGLMSEPATLADYQHSIQCPVLLMTGRYSRRSAVRISELLHKALPQSVLIQTETGHMGPVSQPELVNFVMSQFLQDQALLT